MDAYAPFRSRDYRLLLTGSFLQALGLQMLSVAVGWDLYVRTKSPVMLGNVGFAQVAPFIFFALFAGHVADVHDRRRVMILTQVIYVGASSLLALAGSPEVWLIYACLFFTATARSFQGPSRMALIPGTVGPGALRTAITWNSSASEIASVSGPAVAGFLVAASGSHSVYIIQCACAAGSLLCFLLMHAQPRQTPATTQPGRFLDGMRFVWHHKLILPAISLDMFAVLFGGATVLLPIYAVEILKVGPVGLGWLRAAPPIGAVSMALFTAHRLHIVNAGKALLVAVAGYGAATAVFGISRWFWLSFAMLIVTGALDNISVVLRHSLVQTETPDYVKGRVLAVNNIFISCSNQLGAVESGWAAALLGTVPSVVAGGIVTILIATFWSTSKALREWQTVRR